MARPCSWTLLCIVVALSMQTASAWRPTPSLEGATSSSSSAASGRDLLQACSITNCIRCRNERVSSFTPIEICLTCSGGYTPALPARTSCGKSRGCLFGFFRRASSGRRAVLRVWGCN